MFDEFEWTDSVGDASNDLSSNYSWTDSIGDFANSVGNQIGNWGSEWITDPIENAWNTGEWDFDGISDVFNGGSTNWLDQLVPLGDAPSSGNWGGGSSMVDNVSSTLSTIFNNKMTPWAIKGLGALYEGSQNKKASSDLKKLAQSQAFDPFGSQRPIYQQQLQQATQNPNSIPLIKQQTDAIARAQAIKDAAAGRRSNNATSSPGMLAAQAQAAQSYINSMMQPAGANIAPNSNAIANIMGQSINTGTQGYASPILNVLSNYTKNNQNQDMLSKLFG